MLHRFSVEKMRKNPSRRFPLFPRFGFVIEIGGRRISYRQASLFEAFYDLFDKGPTVSNWQKIRKRLLDEIRLEPEAKTNTINVHAKTLSSTAKGPRRLFKTS